MKVGFKGRFSLQVSGGKRGTVKLVEFDNLITNQGLDRLGVGGICTYCRIGSGNRLPSVNDIALENFTAETRKITKDNSGFEPEPIPRSFNTRIFRFDKGEGTGNHSEVGVGWEIDDQTELNPLWSRAIIVDSNGEPLTITVLEDEILDVYYTLYVYLSLEDHVAEFYYKNVKRTATTRVRNVKVHSYIQHIMDSGFTPSYYWWCGGAQSVLGDVYTDPTYKPDNTSSYEITNSTYVNGSYELEKTYMLKDTNVLKDNLIGIAVVPGVAKSYYDRLEYKTQFDPPLEKDYTEEFYYKGKIKWGRYETPSP